MNPRRSRYRVLSITLVLAAVCAPALAQDGVALLHKMQQALGGADKIAAVRDFDETVSAQTFSAQGAPTGATVRKRIRWIRPNILRLDQMGPGDTYVLYFDGTGGWEILPNKTYALLAGSELQFAKNYLRGLDLNVWLADRDPQFTLTSPAPNVIDIADRANAGKKMEFTLDPATFLPVKNSAISISDTGQPIAQEMHLEQWTAVEGIRFPHRSINIHDSVKRAEITVESVKLNSGMNPADLALKPANLAPVIAGNR
jgi:hypothetical protein